MVELPDVADIKSALFRSKTGYSFLHQLYKLYGALKAIATPRLFYYNLLIRVVWPRGRDGGTGRRSGLKIRRYLVPWGFNSPSRHHPIPIVTSWEG
jgi:hypothetical protein